MKLTADKNGLLGFPPFADRAKVVPLTYKGHLSKARTWANKNLFTAPVSDAPDQAFNGAFKCD